MLLNAILKVKTEMDSNKNIPYFQVVGGFILQHLDRNPLDAEKILDKEKTIAKSLDEMKKAAEKKKVGNCAVLTDQEGFEVVLKYFGIEKPVLNTFQSTAPEVGNANEFKPNAVGPKTEIDFDIKLEDLL